MTRQSFAVGAIAAFVLIASAGSASAASNEASGFDRLVAVWENVWEDSGAIRVVDADASAPSYDDTQWTRIIVPSGSGTPGCCDHSGLRSSLGSARAAAAQCELVPGPEFCAGQFFLDAQCDPVQGCVTDEPLCCDGVMPGTCYDSGGPSSARGAPSGSCGGPCLSDDDCPLGFCDKFGKLCDTPGGNFCMDTVHPQKCKDLGGYPQPGSVCRNDDGYFCGSVPQSEPAPVCCDCSGVGPFPSVCFESFSGEHCEALGCEAVPGGTCDPVSETCILDICGSNEDCEDENLCTNDVCDPNNPQADEFGCAFPPVVCDNGMACDGDESCDSGTGNCLPGTPVICDDGDVCTGVEVCEEPGGTCTDPTDLVCDDGESCTSDSCDPVDGCEYEDLPDESECDDSNACTDGELCIEGACTGGIAVTCDDMDTCTADSCDPENGGCVYDTVVESPACGSCDNGDDDDDDGDADAEDCDCATLCEQQRFAVVTTFVPSNPRRRALYSGSDVTIGQSSDPLPYPTGGMCITNGVYRAGNTMALLATNGSSNFGKGSSLNPDILNEEGLDDIDLGSERVTYIQLAFASDNGPERFGDIPPFVGPGTCDIDPMLECFSDADCGAGNDCENQLLLNDPMNAYVDRTGTADLLTRCNDAQATVAAEGAFLESLAGNVAGFDDGTQNLRTRANTPLVNITVGAGQQVVHVRRVQIAGKTTLRFTRDPGAMGPPTVLIVRVDRTLRFGGEAVLDLVGIEPENVIWNAEGTAGGQPKLLRKSQFQGTILAAERRGVRIGGEVILRGAVKAQRVHISQGALIDHVPFRALVLP